MVTLVEVYLEKQRLQREEITVGWVWREIVARKMLSNALILLLDEETDALVLQTIDEIRG